MEIFKNRNFTLMFIGRILTNIGDSTTQQVMASFAIASLTTILTRKLKVYMISGSTPRIEAGSHSFSDIFVVMISVALIGAILAVTLRNPKASAQSIHYEVI